METFFTPAQRSMIVDDIFDQARYGDKEEQYGERLEYLFCHQLSISSSVVHSIIGCPFHYRLSIPSSVVHSIISCLFHHQLPVPPVIVHSIIGCPFHHRLSVPSSVVHSIIVITFISNITQDISPSSLTSLSPSLLSPLSLHH